MKRLLTATAVMSMVVSADEAPETKAWMTHTELGYVQTQGNTRTDSFTLDLTAKRKFGAHSVKLDFDVLYGTQDNVENRNKFTGEFNYDYKIIDSVAVNYLFGYRDDKFSGFDYQLYTGPGMKFIAVDDQTFHFDVQANALYAVDQGMDKYFDANTTEEIKYPYINGLDGAAKNRGLKDEYNSYVGKLNFSWVILEGLKFLQEAAYRGDFEDQNRYFVNSKTGLESKINNMLSMGISYKVDYTNQPPAGNERADRTFMTSLIIDY